MRLRRIYWHPRATDADRRACGNWLASCGLTIISITAPAERNAPHRWAVRRAEQ